MATVAQIEDALRNADAAGDTEAARRLADALVAARGQQANPRSQGAPVPSYEQYRKDLDLPKAKGPGYFSPETAAGVLRSANQGSIPLLGTISDEIASGVNTAIGYNPRSREYFDYSRPLGKSYSENLAAERGALKKFRKERPYTAMASEVAGGTPLGFGIAKAIPAAATKLGRIGQGFGAGGLFGLGYGFGAGEGGLASRLKSANQAGLIGSLFGAGIPGAIEGGGSAIGAGRRAVAARVSDQGKRSLAIRKVVESIMQDTPGAPPGVAMSRARQIVDELGPEAVLADTGENIRMLTGAVYRAGGAPKTVIGDKIVERQHGVRDPETQVLSGGQYGRLSGMLDDLVPEDALATKTALAKPTEAGRGFYDEAYAANQSVDSPEIRRLLKTPAGKKALDLAVRRLQNRMSDVSKPDPELTAVYNELRQLGKVPDKATGRGVGRGLKLQTLDLVKRRLYNLEQQAKRQELAGTVPAGEAQAIGDIRRKLTAELDRLDETARAGPKSFKAEGGAYARARSAEGARLRAKDAFKSGEHFLTKADFRNPKEMRAALAEMSPEELHAFRVSAAGYLKRRIGDLEIGRDRTRELFNIPNLEEKVAMAFGDADTFARYIRGAKGERELYKLYSEITGGSPTQPRQMAQKALETDPGAKGQAAMDIARNPGSPSIWLGAGARYLGNLAKKAGTVPEPVRLEMARALMSRDVDALTRAIEGLGLERQASRELAQTIMAANLAQSPGRAMERQP